MAVVSKPMATFWPGEPEALLLPPMATFPLPKLPLALEFSPLAKFALLLPLAFAMFPVATLLLPDPLAFESNPLAMLELPLPLALEFEPDAILLL